MESALSVMQASRCIRDADKVGVSVLSLKQQVAEFYAKNHIGAAR
ncbi:hypothetical protein [Cohnella fermenti]|nr:hypothetical protein [Cohnella fermenti]